MAGITINLAGNFSKLDELKDKAARTAASIKGAFSSGAGKAMFAGVGVAAAVAFTGVVSAVKSAIDAGGELQDAMTKTGASGKELLILQQAFKNAGLSASDAGSAISRLQKALAGVNEEGKPTNDAFENLGLSVRDLSTIDPGSALRKVGEAISKIQDPAKRAAVSMQLFGRSGANMLAVFSDPEAFEQAKIQLGSLADKLPEMAGDLDAVGDAFGAWDVKLRQLGVGVLEGLIPNIKSAVKTLNEIDLTETGNGIGVLTREAILSGSAIKAMADEFLSFTGALDEIDSTFNAPITPEELDQSRQQAQDELARSLKDQAAKTAEGAAAADPFAEPGANLSAEQRAKADEDFEKEKAENRDQAAKRDELREQYELEQKITAAQIAGDDKKAAALQRELDILKEIARIKGQPGSAYVTYGKTARELATERVDTRALARDAMERRKQAKQANEDERVDIASRITDKKREIAGLQYQSSIGSISSMQRIGGGGGAVASGLDYQRQAADLQREANNLLRQLLEANRRDVET